VLLQSPLKNPASFACIAVVVIINDTDIPNPAIPNAPTTKSNSEKEIDHPVAAAGAPTDCGGGGGGDGLVKGSNDGALRNIFFLSLMKRRRFSS
jgi:hypothetical protein